MPPTKKVIRFKTRRELFAVKGAVPWSVWREAPMEMVATFYGPDAFEQAQNHAARCYARANGAPLVTPEWNGQ